MCRVAVGLALLLLSAAEGCQPSNLGVIQAITYTDQGRNVSVLTTDGDVHVMGTMSAWNCFEGMTLWRTSMGSLYCD